MANQEGRRVTIGQIKMADRRGLYSSPSIEPEGCTYSRTFSGGHLCESEPGKLEYADFDLYRNEGEGTYCYRFWQRHTDAQTGKETSRSYAEPVLGFTSEDEAIQHALSVYRGEQPEYISADLQEWRRQAWWLMSSIVLEYQAKDDPAKVPELYRLVTELRDQVHPAAKLHWEGLERTLKLALRDNMPAPTPPPAEWAGATRWGKKLDKTWTALEKAHKELLSTIKVPPGRDEELLDKVQEALVEYLDTARRVRDVRSKEVE